MASTVTLRKLDAAVGISDRVHYRLPRPQGFGPECTEPRKPYKRQIVWFNAIGFLLLHIGMVYGFYLVLSNQCRIMTILWIVVLAIITTQSVQLGAHRLYTHRSFKATLPLRILVIFWHTVASQNCMWVWVRDHRQHHLYSDTDADPHNASRGFFFSHIGWLMVRKHPDVLQAGKKVDMSDIEADPLVMFQKKYYTSLYILFALCMPVVVPVVCWEETWWNSFFVAYLLRTFVGLNLTWTVNSWAHLYGDRPFNKDIYPRESTLHAFFTLGEGWHNYHHTFPWDYRAAEFGRGFNLTRNVIEMFERWGWAYDLKIAPQEMVEKKALRSGDGTYVTYCKGGSKEKSTAKPELES